MKVYVVATSVQRARELAPDFGHFKRLQAQVELEIDERWSAKRGDACPFKVYEIEIGE